MNLRHRMDKEPIELLLGLVGAVQYLAHTLKDQETYSVWVKTKAGNRQITIPAVAIQQIQFQKPTPAIIDSIRRQLTDELASNAGNSSIEEAVRPRFPFLQSLLSLFGRRK